MTSVRHHCNHVFLAGRAHVLYGHDGSVRTRAIAGAWYVELTIRGRYINVGWF